MQKNDKGFTPLDTAIFYDNLGTKAIIRNAGGRCNKKC